MGMTTAINQAIAVSSGTSPRDSRLFGDGAIVGKWRVLALIGKGGNGEVYRVKHIEKGTLGALKVPLPNDHRLKARFDIELEILRAVAPRPTRKFLRVFCLLRREDEASRHFPRLLDYGEVDDKNVPYLVIEHLQELKGLPVRDGEVRKFILGVGEAIKQLHHLGFLHRDVKPENVMVRENGDVVLIDFGLAARIADIDNPIADRISMLQGRACGVGTEGSAAPEQLFGHATVRSDIYALGSLANDCFRAKPPANWRLLIQKALNPRADNRQQDIDEFMCSVEKIARWRKMALRILIALIMCFGLYQILRIANDAKDREVERSLSLDDQLRNEASEWRLKAAECGDLAAQCALAKYYEDESELACCCGDNCGVETNLSLAVLWYRRAADQGNATAQYRLGCHYFDGRGIETNQSEAVKWYHKAAEQGLVDAQSDLAKCYYYGYGVEPNVRMYLKWCRKAAEQGNVVSQYALGNSYFYGVGMESNVVESIRWYSKAAAQGDAESNFLVGNIYFEGIGVKKDCAKAAELYRKAAKLYHARAAYKLGYCYKNGLGVDENLADAVVWYADAAMLGDEKAKAEIDGVLEAARQKGIPIARSIAMMNESTKHVRPEVKGADGMLKRVGKLIKGLPKYAKRAVGATALLIALLGFCSGKVRVLICWVRAVWRKRDAKRECDRS